MSTELWGSLQALLQEGARGEEPWLGWLVLALCRQRARQDWLVAVARERLGDVDEDQGDVPGMPGWTYDYHGRGLGLAGPDRELLDVDFYGGDVGPQTIDPHFFVTRVLALSPKPAVEQRLVAWFGEGRELLLAGLEMLRDRGLLQHPTSTHVFHLHPWLELHHASVASGVEGSWDVWCARLGDLQDGNQRDGFAAWMAPILEDRSRAGVIEELAPLLPRDVALSSCRRLCEGPIDSVTGRAVRTLRRLGAVPEGDAMALCSRLDPLQHNPFSAVELAEWLFEHGRDAHALALVRRFSAQRKIPGFVGNPFDAAYAILAMRFAPSVALGLIRQALRSRVPDSLHTMGALLSVLDEPWCRAELLSAARDAEDLSALRFLLGCLMHSSDADTRTVAREMVPPPPDFSGAAVGYTHEEVAYLNLRESVAHHRSRMEGVAALLRPH